jgi:hypothetical protein
VTTAERGFLLTRLTLVGTGVEDAVVEFRDGLNVISGPSDTGKTFIVQCVDFLLGAKTAPKAIPEAKHYTAAFLDLRARSDGTEYRIERALRGGDVVLHSARRGDRVLAARHGAEDEDTLSSFLLGLMGSIGKKVRTNDRGSTRTLSFRDVVRLILVDEEAIIGESSPVLSGQYITATAEKSVFRLLLTGMDDSKVVEVADKKLTRGREEGRNEILDTLINKINDDILTLGLEQAPDAWKKELQRLEEVFDDASQQLNSEQQGVFEIETRRRSAWVSVRQMDSRMQVLAELQSRFELLRAQYASDLARLEAIAEAGLRLAQLPEQRCPICGALPDHQSTEHQHPAARPEDVASASDAEGKKIGTLLNDLEVTLASNLADMDEITREGDRHRSELTRASDELRSRLQPRIQNALERVRLTEERRNVYRRAVDLRARLADLEDLLKEEPDSRHDKAGFRTNVGGDEAERFTQAVERLLRDWHFPALDRVTFSEQDQDILISGNRRNSHGKGVRAITHAAFNIGLMNYCRETGLPHPLFVVLDSPLVVYREPDVDEHGTQWHVKDAFYRSLSGRHGEQLLILENEDPPTDVAATSNVIEFTKSSFGRRGFIPPRMSDEQ